MYNLDLSSSARFNSSLIRIRLISLIDLQILNTVVSHDKQFFFLF